MAVLLQGFSLQRGIVISGLHVTKLYTPTWNNKNNVAFTDGPDSSQINKFVEQALVVKRRIALSTR